MILGFWNGTTPSVIERRIAKVRTEKDKIHATINQAVADRATAIRALQDELTQFESLVSQV